MIDSPFSKRWPEVTRPRIALVCLHTSPLDTPGSGDAGGMNVYLLGVAHGLVSAGFDVELLTRRTSMEQPDSILTEGGALVRFVTAGPPATLAKQSLLAVIDSFTEAIAALGPYDLVHSHYWLSGLAGLRLSKALKVPHILSLHTVAALKNAALAEGDSPEPEARLIAERMLTRESTLTIAASRAEADAIASAYGIEERALAVVTPGVDTTLFHPRDAAEATPATVGTVAGLGPAGFLLVAARIQPLKGQDLAIRALAQLDDAVRPALLLAGDAVAGREDYLESLVQLATGLGIADSVVFTGPLQRRELAALMRNARLVLVPSHSETFGLVTLEAAASGVPVIASRASGLMDSVVEGVTGVLLDSRDPADWAGSIGGFLAEPKRLQELGRRATRYAAEADWAATAAAVGELYLSALGADAVTRLVEKEQA